MSKKLGIFLCIIIIGVAIAAIYPYATLNPADSRVKLNTAFSLHYTVLVLHIGFAFIALVSGLFQFHRRFRNNYPAWHRALGRVYVVSVTIGGLLGLVMTLYIESFTKAMAFVALSLLWLLTTWKGFRYAVKKQIDEHRVWMIRSYAITLVATSARLVVPICILLYLAMQGFDLPAGGREQMVADILEINIWVGLLINLIGVEWFLLRASKGK
ncbi:DUF2306 domain-containing protein [Paenibacillus sp. TAF58]